MQDNLYGYIHIPKVGGTSFINKLGGYLDRTNDRHIKIYNYSAYSEYKLSNIPRMENRTDEQQENLKLVTGHNITSTISFRSGHDNINFFTIVRNPLDRLLSSFNHRHSLHQFNQDPNEFSLTYPPMNRHALNKQKTAEDYDNLSEWYVESTNEHNLQCKFLLKTFYHYDERANRLILRDNINDREIKYGLVSWPEWINGYNIDDDTWKLIEDIVKQRLWYAITTEDINKFTPKFAKHIGLEYVDHSDIHVAGGDLLRYWSQKDFFEQEHVSWLVSREKYDFKLHELVRTLESPIK